jgi:hypothetical protein
MEHGLFLASGIVIHHHARKSTPQLEIEWVTFGEHRWVISRECRSAFGRFIGGADVRPERSDDGLQLSLIQFGAARRGP